MKKWLLFVDDDPLYLKEIQRMLEPMWNEWVMDTAPSGNAALDTLLRAQYDVVITDLLMPGMDGVSLLEFVRSHSPHSIRLVLSGDASHDRAMACAGLAHQFLAKPCDAETLRRTISRVTGVSYRAPDALLTLLAGMKQLPTLPASYHRLVRLLSDPATTTDEIGALIASDVAMTAKVLQLVNSSFFGLARNVSRPAEAAAFLGLETLKALVLATSVFAQFERNLPKAFSATDLTEHSQKVSTAARAIAKSERCAKGLVDECMVAGLLHDAGKLVFASNVPVDYQQVLSEKTVPLTEGERQTFGATHADVGGYLLGLWGLPLPIVEAIAFHHTPSESGSSKFSALTAVHVANVLVAEMAPVTGGPPRAEVDTAYLQKMGVLERLPAWREILRDLAPAPSLS